MKAFRLLVIFGAIQLLPLPEADARPAYCDAALARCVSKCNAYPDIFRDACKIGCGIGYLSCGD